MNLSNDERKKLLKWGVIGGSSILVMLAITLSVAFSGKYNAFTTESNTDSNQSGSSNENTEFEVVIGDDVPYLEVDQNLPQMEQHEELNLKEKLWSYYQQGDIQLAAELILEEFKENQFSEESELYDWYVDLSFLNVLGQVSDEERAEALKNIRVPRLLAMNLVQEIRVLDVATVIHDPESLVPYAVTNVLFENETLIEDIASWESPSEHAEALKDSLQCVWEIELRLDGQPLTAVVGRMKATNKNAIIGFYGTHDDFFTDEYIEEKRYLLEQIPVFQ